ncbi:MAG: TetR/AcrR family transcriptional regulator [Pseudomonadota bacterium]|jgi:AcrR family transcriptional regulator
MSNKRIKEAAPAPGNRGRVYRGVSEEARRAERKQAFIRAGIEIFARDGFAGATTRSLCAEAGLTQRYFYESFASLEDLFVAVTNHLGAQLEAHIDAAVAGAHRSAEAITRASLTAFFGFMLEDRRAARILLIEILTVGPRLELSLRRFSEGRAEHLRTLIEQLHPGIKRNRGNVRLIASGLVGAARSIAVAWMSGGYAEPLEEVVDSALRLYSAILPARRRRASPV